MDTGEVIDALARLLTLADHNTRVVLIGAAILGVAAGIMGSFMMLRRRAMISDVVSHAALPGIVAAFMITAGWPGGGKHLPHLLAGALISGLAGMACVHLITRYSRIKEDAALGIVLSVFFGFGVVLMGMAQRMRTGSAAGLDTFIYGKTASMLAGDAWLMAGAALVVVVVCLALFKEFRLLTFDAEFARAQGMPVHVLDGVMTALVVMVTVIGLQAVGLILMIALLIIPPSAARFWTDRLGVLVALSAAIGGFGAVTGAALSAVFPSTPAGAVIVLVCAMVFVISLVGGTRRGLARSVVRRLRLAGRMERQHLLRSLYEAIEPECPDIAAAPESSIPMVNAHDLATLRRWPLRRLQSMLRAAARDRDVSLDAWPLIRLTGPGLRHARSVVRNHRLWEWYLISHADIAASHVDRDADEIEHVLGEDMVVELERTLALAGERAVPESPHPIAAVPAGEDGR